MEMYSKCNTENCCIGVIYRRKRKHKGQMKKVKQMSQETKIAQHESHYNGGKTRVG